MTEQFLKRCARCKELKPAEDFSPSKQKRDGLSSYCKACAAKKARERYAKSRNKGKQDTSADDGSDCNKTMRMRRRGRPSLTTQKRRVRQLVLQPQSLKKAIPDYKNGKVVFIDETTMRPELKSVRFKKMHPPKKRIISPTLKRSKKVVKNVSGYHRSDALDGCVFRVLKYERQGGARYSIEEVRTGERYFRAFADKEKFLADILSLVKNY